MRAVGFHAPEDSYLRRLFTKRRLEYLTDLLDRPDLLALLPRYRELQTRLELERPVDMELRVALEALGRIGTAGAPTIRLVERLWAAGYHFAFADVDLIALAAADAGLGRAVERPYSVRAAIERRLRGRAHVARSTTDLDEGTTSLERMSRMDFLRIAIIQASLEYRGPNPVAYDDGSAA